MFRKIYRSFVRNPLDVLLEKAKKRKVKRVILGWNRGLGDIALGLYAVVHRIKEHLPDCEVIFIVRKDLYAGFQMLQGVRAIVADIWERGKDLDIYQTLDQLQIKIEKTDLIIAKPDPTYWAKWQRGRLIPKLEWHEQWDDLWKNFLLKSTDVRYMAVQPSGETNYNTWRNWPYANWNCFFKKIDEQKLNIKVLLLGNRAYPSYPFKCVMDLRGKTDIFEMFSIIKNCCSYAVLPDSGLLSVLYYLNVSFPIRVISLWANPLHGVLKQNVPSPNVLLEHFPLISPKKKKLSLLDPDKILQLL